MINLNFIKRIILLIFNPSCLNIVLCQTSEIDLHKKYWYYKTDLTTIFLALVHHIFKWTFRSR